MPFDRRGLAIAALVCFGVPVVVLVVAASAVPEHPGAVLLGLLATTSMISRLTRHVEAWVTPKSMILEDL